ncbi:MAG: hypothetical protein CMM46_07755 [Rhodospirillaceae bacterium]|nr:hypothetical protein [Rhodospirillaceae bacterium]|tara:strand:+ start:3859 stop:5394 length:1536 start_codon:yes stop_codon:yes gene_type:complete
MPPILEGKLMVRLVEFDAATEELVRFVEETPRADIIDATIARVKAGENPKALVRAAALAVSRSSELPADHHGGPIHPIAGIHAVMGMIDRLGDDHSQLPALQCVALANKHVHMPSMGPAAMVQFDDLKRDVEKDRVLDRLEKALTDREPRLAERAMTLACEKAAPGEIMNRLLTVSLPRNSLDDHYFLYPLYAMRALDKIGWEWGPILLRPVVRYLSRHASFDAFGEFDEEAIVDGIAFYKRFPELEELVETYGLNEDTVPEKTGAHETEAIAALADRVGAVTTISEMPQMVAKALGSGLSLEGTCEALSIGGGRIFLRSHTANPFDVHIHTGIAARRYLIGLPGIDFRKKCIALIGWAWSYEIRYLDHTLQWSWESVANELSAEPADVLLERIEAGILGVDGYDVTNLPVAINLLVATDSVRDVVRLAEFYVKAGHDVDDLLRLTTRLICREDASEMHAYKLQQAAFEEYQVCRDPLNWVHAVSAVKQCAVAAPTLPQRFYPEIVQRLAA